MMPRTRLVAERLVSNLPLQRTDHEPFACGGACSAAFVADVLRRSAARQRGAGGYDEDELAAAIVVHNDRVLVVRRSKEEVFLPRNWGIPCGKIDRASRLRMPSYVSSVRKRA